MLGISRAEIDEKLDEVIDFAEIREFIDAPVQSYSSGMQVRLGFAVATALEPDILIIDEVLAVGDVTFRVKCYNRIRDIAPKTAVILVSHSMFDIGKICSRVVVLDKGESLLDSDARAGIQLYNQLNADKSGNGSLKYTSEKIIHSVCLKSVSSKSSVEDSDVNINLTVRADCSIPQIKVRIVFFDINDASVAEWDSLDKGKCYALESGSNDYNLHLKNIRLISGVYRIVVVLSDLDAKGYYLRIDQGISVSLVTNYVTGAPYRI